MYPAMDRRQDGKEVVALNFYIVGLISTRPVTQLRRLFR